MFPMNFNTSPVLIFLLVLSLISPTTQQSSVAKAQGQKKEGTLSTTPLPDKITSSTRHALEVLDELIGQTKNFAPGPFGRFKVSLVQADTADLLWSYDQARARSLFEAAFKSSQTMRPKATTGRAAYPPNHLEIETEIIEYVLNRDARFAEELVAVALKAAEASVQRSGEPDWAFRNEQAVLYSQIARGIAASDQEHAAELAKASFNGWFGADQVIALNALRRQAPRRSDEIFLYALTVLNQKLTNLSNKVAILAPYAFPDIDSETNFYIRKAGGSPNQRDSSAAVRKAFLEFVYETFMRQPVASQIAETSGFGTASFASFAMRELLVRFDQNLPEKAPAIRARVKEIISGIKKAGRQDMFDSESEAWSRAFRGNVQELLHKAEATKDQAERDHFNTEAIGLLVYRDGDLEQALSLAEKVSEGSSKTYLIATIREARADKAINDGDPEKAYLLSRDIQELDHRCRLLVRIAKLLVNRGNRERARAVWGEAFQAAKSLEAGWGQIHELLDLAEVAAEIDPEIGFEAMRETVEIMNNAKGGSIHEGISRGAGERLQFFGRFDFDDSFALLARADFERALRLAESMTSREAATLAQFAACKGVLRKSN